MSASAAAASSAAVASSDNTTDNNNNNNNSNKTFPPETPSILSCFVSIRDLAFDLPLKDVGEALYIISRTAEFKDAEKEYLKLQQNEQDDGEVSFHLVPAKVQTFKENFHQRIGLKFGFVEFHVKEKSSSSSSTSSKTKTKSVTPELIQKIHVDMDRVFSGVSYNNFKFRLQRIPDDIIDCFQQSKLITESKDQLKILCLMAARLVAPGQDVVPFSLSTATTTTTASAASTSSNEETVTANKSESSNNKSLHVDKWRLSQLHLLDMALLKQEITAEKFPKTVVSAEGLSEFLKEMLPKNSCEHFVVL